MINETDLIDIAEISKLDEPRHDVRCIFHYEDVRGCFCVELLPEWLKESSNAVGCTP